MSSRTALPPLVVAVMNGAAARFQAFFDDRGRNATMPAIACQPFLHPVGVSYPVLTEETGLPATLAACIYVDGNQAVKLLSWMRLASLS